MKGDWFEVSYYKKLMNLGLKSKIRRTGGTKTDRIGGKANGYI